ncbi:hypothetical protein [Halomarina litorea]|uniref:hypothetical protein n=1 Tax=Halomarina litorea TaxID=2961595 RepID=UPI0020C45F25|nr:hypothetical protein [Halomarina sp. BCD28]
MPQTDYHDWPFPVLGGDAEVWDEILEDLVDLQDEAVIKKGTLANRPASTDPASGEPERWYLTTDESPPGLYLDTGPSASGWVTIWDGDAQTVGGESASAFLARDGSTAMQAGLPFGGYAATGVGSLVFSDTDSDGSAFTLREGSGGLLEVVAGGSVIATVDETGRVLALDNGGSTRRLATRSWAASEGHNHTAAGESSVPNSGLVNSTVTLSAGTWLSGGGAVGLGGSATVDVDRVQAVIDNPDPLPVSRLKDTQSVEIAVPVPNGDTITVYRWGAFDASTGSAPTGLSAELVDDSDTVVASAETSDAWAHSGVASWTNNTGSFGVAKVRANNETGSDLTSPGVGGQFGFLVE